jgi:hypothetical protein
MLIEGFKLFTVLNYYKHKISFATQNPLFIFDAPVRRLCLHIYGTPSKT